MYMSISMYRAPSIEGAYGLGHKLEGASSYV